jgi:hypothetical protein
VHGGKAFLPADSGQEAGLAEQAFLPCLGHRLAYAPQIFWVLISSPLFNPKNAGRLHLLITRSVASMIEKLEPRQFWRYNDVNELPGETPDSRPLSG